MKNIAKIGIIFMVALLAACQSEYDVIENGVFLTDAQKSQSKKVTIDDTGAKTVISSRLGTMMTTDVTVEYGTDATALQAYNQKTVQIISCCRKNFTVFRKVRQQSKLVKSVHHRQT